MLNIYLRSYDIKGQSHNANFFSFKVAGDVLARGPMNLCPHWFV